MVKSGACIGVLLVAVSFCMAGRAPERRNIIDCFGKGGVIPHPADMSHLAHSYLAQARNGAKSGEPIPAKWDSREHGWVTSVKNQGSYGTCWAHSALAALETALKKNDDTDNGDDWDLSENHMANHYVGFVSEFTDGGNNQMATALLTSWRDPLRESDDPYPDIYSIVDLPPVKHVQNVVWFPMNEDAGYVVTDIRDIDEIYKRAVMEYGAVSIPYFHCQKACKDSTTHYLPEYAGVYLNSKTDGGHAVTLIGWDDDYPAANFNYTPPGNGAFLCKNSWGPWSGDGGYIWISYYDSCTFTSEGAAFPEPESTDNYGRLYEYDPCGFVGDYNVLEDGDIPGSKTNWCANVFQASTTGIVDAVGFYSLSVGTEYELSVYTGCAVKPNSGTLVSRQTGTIDFAGYVTVKLNSPAEINTRGERFSIVLKLECPDTEYPIAVETSRENWCNVHANRGESFLSGDGENWTDFQDISFANGDENVCIKAYTKAGADGERIMGQALYVDAASTAEHPDGTMENPFATISNAMAFALIGDSILVRPGIYREMVEPRLGLYEIRSTDGPDVTVIDGEGARRCYITDKYSLTRASGFTFRNGFVESADGIGGAGVYGGKLSHSVVSNCFSCSAAGYTGEIKGGGIMECTCDNVLIVHNTVSSGEGRACGGGVSTSTLINCTIADNIASGFAARGGGIHECVVYNSIVSFNEIQCEDALQCEGDNLYRDLKWGLLKVFADGDPGFVDREHGNYRLSAGSQCVDAGLVQAIIENCGPAESDLANESRVIGWEVDQGCYEYSQEVWFQDWTVNDSYYCQTNDIVIYADGEWSLETDDSWINPIVDYGIGCATVKVEVAENETGVCRYGTLYLYGAGADRIDWCDIIQSARTTRGNKHYGLFAGIGDYAPSFPKTKLMGCVNDVTRMRAMSLASGLWHEENTLVLTNSEATVSGIRTAMTNFAAIAESGDTFLYYQSSHGTDTDNTDQSLMSLIAYNGYYRDFELAQDLSLFRSGVKIIVVADTCHSGGLFKDYSWSRAGHSFAERMSELTTGPAFITAADFDQYSWDTGRYPDNACGGVFTVAFIEGWKTGLADSDGDGKLNFLELAEYAAARAIGVHRYTVSEWTEAQTWNESLLAESLAGYVPGNWPDPEVYQDDSDAIQAEKVRDALVGAGFSQDAASSVTTEAQYNAIVDWNTDNDIGVQAQTQSPAALISPALGANCLLDLTCDDVVITEFRHGAADGMYTMKVSIDGYDVQKVNAGLLKAALGVVGAANVSGEYTADGLTFDVQPGEDAVDIEVVMPDNANSCFLKAVVR